jgi:hypothetical protein
VWCRPLPSCAQRIVTNSSHAVNSMVIGGC